MGETVERLVSKKRRGDFIVSIEKIKKSFTDCDRCIFLCSDNGFVPVSAVAIQSIIETSNPNEKYDILLFTSKIEPFHKPVIESLSDHHDNISIRVVEMDNIVSDHHFYTENRDTITAEAYYRLIVPFIMEEGYHRAVYIDCDMVLLKNINVIFNNDVDNYYIGGVRDYWGICGCYMPNSTLREYRTSMGLDCIDDYIISSTILFNLDEYRKNFSIEEVLALASSKKWRQHDQDVINCMCKNHIMHISAEWGYMTEWGRNNHYLPLNLREEFESIAEIAIYHYGGGRKPWKKYYEKENDFFWRYARKTPYFEYLIGLIRSAEYKCYVLKKLCNGNFDRTYTCNNIYFKTDGIAAGNINLGYVQYRVITIKDSILHLEGSVAIFPLLLTDELKAHITLNGEVQDVDQQIEENYKVVQLGEYIYRAQSFKTDIRLESGKNHWIKIVGETSGLIIRRLGIIFGKFCVLEKEFKNGYYYKDGWVVTFENNGAIFVRQENIKYIARRELRLFKELWTTGITSNKKAALARLLVKVIKPFIKKPIWLLSDRLRKADDNGEAFFIYLQCHKDEVHSFFIIDKDSKDYNRIRKLGKIVPAYSFRHKLLSLLADYTISSQTDEVFRNPFHRYSAPYRDMLWSTKFVFLQHGVIMTKLTNWLKRSKQSIWGFITSTNKEYQLIREGEYDYDSEVWLTGMPRYDRLECNTEKIITIAPTWRKYLATHQDSETGAWQIIDGFEESKYFCFYRNLLENKRLLEAAKKYGYAIQFKVHPSYLGEEALFHFNDSIKVVDESIPYREIYSKSALMITDYSSSIHDFVYLHKPIIYCQFDKDEFFSGKHIVDDSTIDYEKDGYGEVEYTVEGTVSRIIEYMETGCALKEKYRERIDKAFPYTDKKNCERVYRKIMDDL